MGRLCGFSLQLLRKTGIKNFQAAIEGFANSASNMEEILKQVKFYEKATPYPT